MSSRSSRSASCRAAWTRRSSSRCSIRAVFSDSSCSSAYEPLLAGLDPLAPVGEELLAGCDVVLALAQLDAQLLDEVVVPFVARCGGEAPVQLRLAGDEAGFTLVELAVVALRVGALPPGAATARRADRTRAW